MEEKGGLWWEKMSLQGSPVIFLNGTCTGEAQMEVSRLFQIIEMVRMRWGERDAPNGDRKPEFGGGWRWSPDEARFSGKSFSKLFQIVLGCSDCSGGFLEVIRRCLGEKKKRRKMCLLVENCG